MSASGTSSKPINAIRPCRPAFRSARVHERRNERRTEAVARADRIRDWHAYPGYVDGSISGTCDRSARSAGEGHEAGPEPEDRLRNIGWGQVRVNPGGVVLA